jgi:hypothetical protein
MVVSGQVKEKRTPLLQRIVRCEPAVDKVSFRMQLLKDVKKHTLPNQVAVFDAEFELAELQTAAIRRRCPDLPAGCLAPIPSGFWARSPASTPGRLRRSLQQIDFSTLPIKDPRLRKKNSVMLHPPKGIAAHRRQQQAA